MANAASRIFQVMKKTGTNTISEYIVLKVISKNPLKLTDGDKLILTSDFLTFSNEIDLSKISIGDVFNAITLNDGQTYLINEVKSSTNELFKYNNEIKALQDRVTALENRITAIENR